MNSKWIIKSLGVVIVLIILKVAALASEQPIKPPNIVLIMADDLGFSDLGCYGGEIETPNIDRLADQGIRFAQFYNCGRCWPTRASVLTGYYPQQTNNDGVRAAFPKWGYLIPHHLKQAGYKSYHSGKWHVPNVQTQIEEGGFDRSYHTGAYNNHFTAQNHYLNDEKLPSIESGGNYYSTNVITNYAIKFLQEHQKRYSKSPFFLYVAYIAPHFPLQAPLEVIDKYRNYYLNGWEDIKDKRFIKQQKLGFKIGKNSPFEYYVTTPWSWPEKYLEDSISGEMRLSKPWHQLTQNEKHLQATKMAIHAAMVDCMDKEIGRILEQLKIMGEDNNTLVLFLSDNGASAEQIIRGNGHDKNVPLGTVNSYLCLGPGFSTVSNTPFRRHKFWTHEGGITTPLIIRWPDKIKNSGDINYSSGHVVDFLPTFIELAGVSVLKEKDGYEAPPLPGKSLVSLIKKDKIQFRELYFSHEGNNALRQGKWKAVISSDIDGRWQLYNMEEDRTELNNLVDDFFEFGNPSWKFSNQERLRNMKARWIELNNLYQNQGKIGLENIK